MNTHQWVTRGVCILILLIGMVWILDQNVALGGYKKVTYAFGDPGPIISELQPVERLGGKEYGADGRSFQKMYEDPVYFDLITPVSYRRATMTVVFRNDRMSTSLRIGVRSDAYSDYSLYDLELIKNGDDGWTVGTATVDLSSARYENGKYRFVLSVPGLMRGDSEKYIQLSAVTLELYRDPIYK